MGNLIYLKPKTESPVEIFQQILDDYRAKHGQPPLVIEYSRLMKWQEVTVPQGCKLVVRAIPLPVNHFLVGVEE